MGQALFHVQYDTRVKGWDAKHFTLDKEADSEDLSEDGVNAAFKLYRGSKEGQDIERKRKREEWAAEKEAAMRGSEKERKKWLAKEAAAETAKKMKRLEKDLAVTNKLERSGNSIWRRGGYSWVGHQRDYPTLDPASYPAASRSRRSDEGNEGQPSDAESDGEGKRPPKPQAKKKRVVEESESDDNVGGVSESESDDGGGRAQAKRPKAKANRPLKSKRKPAPKRRRQRSDSSEDDDESEEEADESEAESEREWSDSSEEEKPAKRSGKGKMPARQSERGGRKNRASAVSYEESDPEASDSMS